MYDWLLSRLAANTDLKQTNYILASLFGRTCHAHDVRTADFVLLVAPAHVPALYTRSISEWRPGSGFSGCAEPVCPALQTCVYASARRRHANAGVQDEEKLDQIHTEMKELKAVLVERLEAGTNALEGGFTSVTQHLWIGPDEASAAAAALLPKLQKSQTSLQKTLFELVTLELAVERRVDAVVLATLMPRYWADFIRSRSDKEARSMGTRPV